MTCSILWMSFVPLPEQELATSESTASTANSLMRRVIGTGRKSTDRTPGGLGPGRFRNGLCSDGLRGRVNRPGVQPWLALLVYLAVWLPLWHTVLGDLTHRYLLHTSSDPSIFIWSLRWWPYAIAHGLNPLHTDLIRSPQGVNLA